MLNQIVHYREHVYGLFDCFRRVFEDTQVLLNPLTDLLKLLHVV